jgi:Outer membrane protein beta-barrel domain
MQSSVKRLMLLGVLVAGLCDLPAFAQKYELNPYAGGMTMSDYKILNFRNPAIFGLRGGVAITDNFRVEGNGGWMNQFNFGGFDYQTHAWLYEVAGAYDFGHVNVRGVVPFVLFGVGGTTIHVNSDINVNHHDTAVYPIPLNPPVFGIGPIPQTLEAFTLQSGDTFFNFSYGGGIKGQRLWGPMGLRFDFRGRTMPNFFASHINSFEATGGLLFSWGER